jgi:hypothetical protein
MRNGTFAGGRLLTLIIVAGTLCWGAKRPAHAELLTIQNDTVKVVFDTDDHDAPKVIQRIGGPNILQTEGTRCRGMGCSWICRENRTKLWYEENKDTAITGPDRTFVVYNPVKRHAAPDSLTDEMASPFCNLVRTFKLGNGYVEATYDVTFTRDARLHLVDEFSMPSLYLSKAFSKLYAVDLRKNPDGKSPGKYLQAAVADPISVNANPMGRTLIGAAAAQEEGAIIEIRELKKPTELGRRATNVLLKKGDNITLSMRIHLFDQAGTRIGTKLDEIWAGMPDPDRYLHWMPNASIHLAAKDLTAVEEALLAAAEANNDWSIPHSSLAGVRRDHGLPGERRAWWEAARRCPYQYGYAMCASAVEDETTDPQGAGAASALLGQLAAIEALAYYPEYYSYAITMCKKHHLYVTALALARQSLAAMDGNAWPKGEQTRKKIQAQIGELEKVVAGTCSELPKLPALQYRETLEELKARKAK